MLDEITYGRIYMNDVFIRKAGKPDLPAIEKLLMKLIESMDSKKGIDTNAVIENCRNLLSDLNTHILVAEADGTIIGFINFTIRKTLLHSAPSGLIDELVVATDYRGKGVGKKLIHAAIEQCKQLGCCEVEVSTELANANAREFYRSCGFDERGVILEKDLP
ncbi:MAG: GNAT family N-acetyltransferase [Candidatus Bathyarchaeia archaeon]